MILPKQRDPRFITIRRGGMLTDADHQLLALWAATCAEHVLPLFEAAQPADPRPRHAIAQARAWARGEIKMTESRTAAGHAMAAARDLRGAARDAAYAAGQAAAVAHVAAHELGSVDISFTLLSDRHFQSAGHLWTKDKGQQSLGAAAYAIKAARAVVAASERDGVGRVECQWQWAQLPDAIRDLVLDDQRLRNAICWFIFDC